MEQEETRGTGLVQPSEEEKNGVGRKHLIAVFHLRRYHREDRATLFLEVNRERNKRQWGQAATRKSPSGHKEKNSSLSEWYNSEAAPGEVVETPFVETFKTCLGDALSNGM